MKIVSNFLWLGYTYAWFPGHDVEREYIRQTLGSVAAAVMDKH